MGLQLPASSQLTDLSWANIKINNNKRKKRKDFEMSDGQKEETSSKFVSDIGPDRVLVRVHIPNLNEKKVVDAPLAIPVWYMKKILCLRIEAEASNIENYGFYLPSCKQLGKPGKWLRESQRLSSYFRGTPISISHELDILFIPKARHVDKEDIERYANQNTKKHKKKFISYVSKGLVHKVRKYCMNGFDPNLRGENGEIPLMIATMNEDCEMIMALLEGGAFIDYRLDHKQNYLSALHLAAAKAKILSLKTLVRHGGWIDIEDSDQRTPLFHAVISGNSEMLMNVLILRPDINHKDSREWTALHVTCVEKDGVAALLLIDSGADMNVKNSVGNTPLHVAAANGADACINCLLSRGCDKDAINRSGQTAVQIATLSGNVEIKQKIMDMVNEVIVPPPPKPVYKNYGVLISPEENIVKPINIDYDLIKESIVRNLNPKRVSYTPSIVSLNSANNNTSTKTLISSRHSSISHKDKGLKEPERYSRGKILHPWIPPPPVEARACRNKQTSSAA